MQGVVINPNPGSATSQRANARGLVVPVMTGLEGLFIYEDSVTRSLKNWAPGKADATVGGAPTMDASGYGIVLRNNANFLQSAISESDNMTVISLQENTVKRGFAVSNYPSTRSGVAGTSNGIGIQHTIIGGTNQGINAFDSQFNGSGGAASSLLIPTGVNLVTGGNRAVALRTVEPAGQVVFNDLTGATVQTVTRAGTVRDKGTGLLRMGSSYSADVGDNLRYFMQIIYSAALSDADLALMYAWAKAYWARRSITV